MVLFFYFIKTKIITKGEKEMFLLDEEKGEKTRLEAGDIIFFYPEAGGSCISFVRKSTEKRLLRDGRDDKIHINLQTTDFFILADTIAATHELEIEEVKNSPLLAFRFVEPPEA